MRIESTWTFLFVHVTCSLAASIICAIAAIKHNWLIWICAVAFFTQAVAGSAYLLRKIAARIMAEVRNDFEKKYYVAERKDVGE